MDAVINFVAFLGGRVLTRPQGRTEVRPPRLECKSGLKVRPPREQLSCITLAIIALAITISISYAESVSDEYPIIYGIKVVGNHVTNENFILREMRLSSGMSADPELLEADRLHLLSLGIFNMVELSIVTDIGRAIVLVRVTERFYIYPYPILQYDPANPSRRIYGIIVSHNNFRGYAERLSFGWWDGYQRGMYLLHSDSWFSIGGKYGLKTQISFNDVEIIAPDGITYRAETESFLLRLRRRLDRDRWIGLESEWEERASKGSFYTLSANGRDRLLVGRLYYEADLRDYSYYPRNGYYFSTILNANRTVDTSHTFYGQQADIRIYKSFGRLTLAMRGAGQITQKKLPWYRQLELSQSEIRTNTPLGLKGSSFFAANLELRINIIPLHYFSFSEIPIAGKYLQNLKFSVEGLLFVDRGYIKYIDTHKVADFTACGVGLQFQLPYIEAARAIIGWDPERMSHPTIILATGVTF